MQKIKESHKSKIFTLGPRITEGKVYSDVEGKGFYVLLLNVQYMYCHIIMQEAATELFDLHNVKQGTSSVTKQDDKSMTNALLIFKGTWSPSHSQFLLSKHMNKTNYFFKNASSFLQKPWKDFSVQLKNKL